MYSEITNSYTCVFSDYKLLYSCIQFEKRLSITDFVVMVKITLNEL